MHDRQKAEAQPGIRTMILCPVASGLLVWLSFYFSWLVWIALVPLSLMIHLRGRRTWLYLGAYLGGLAFYLPGVQWLRYCDPSAWLGWLLLAGYLALYFPLFLLLSRILYRRWKVPLLFAIPITWTALEYVRMHLLTGIGWLFLAHSISHWSWTIQIADVAGVYGVSFLIALVNALWVEYMTTPLFVPQPSGGNDGKMVQNPAMIRRRNVVFTAVLATLCYGSFRTWQSDFEPGPTVILVQTNIEQSLKNTDPDDTFDAVIKLTRQAYDMEADLVIWPETSYPYTYGVVDDRLGDLEVDRLRLERSRRFGKKDVKKPSEETGKKIRHNLGVADTDLELVANQLKKPLLAGVIRTDFRPGHCSIYNSSVLYLPKQGLTDYYDKIHLVPFGEYLPLRDSLPLLRRLMPYEEDAEIGLDHAHDVRSFRLQDWRFAVLICFEDTLPHLTRRIVNAGDDSPVRFLVNQSNDGWFQGSIEADYHLAASVFRCVETRRPMARVSNTGISCLVDANGGVVDVLEKDGKMKNIGGLLKVDVPLDSRSTLYLQLGDWLPMLCLVVSLLGLAASIVRLAYVASNALMQ